MLRISGPKPPGRRKSGSSFPTIGPKHRCTIEDYEKQEAAACAVWRQVEAISWLPLEPCSVGWRVTLNTGASDASGCVFPNFKGSEIRGALFGRATDTPRAARPSEHFSLGVRQV